MTLPIGISRAGEHTLQEQIYQFIRDRVLSGVYRTNVKLPSTRELATGLGVSRNTVMLAYEWLISEGYIETRKGAGTFVCHVVPDGVSAKPFENDAAERLAGVPFPSRPNLIAAYETPALINRASNRPSIDFWYGRPDPRQFPIKVWRRLIVENLARAAANFAEYGVQAGDPELRRAIVDHLATARGLLTDPDHIIITAGAQDALSIICRLLVTQGTKVVVETPCYASAAALFRSYGALLSHVPVDADGIEPISLRSGGSGASLLYTTPSHQFPTGAILGLGRRQAILDWADTEGAYVIEDDYDSEVIYDRPPLAALAALDRSQCVIYIGSFSKTIGAGIRLGYLVLPAELVAPAIAVKSLASYGQPWLDQAVLASFIRQGGFQRHVRRIRTLYQMRRDTVISCLRSHFGNDVRISGHEAGLHLIWHLSPDLPDAEELCAIARTVGIGLYTIKHVGALDAQLYSEPDRRIVLGYAALTPVEIEAAFRRLAAALPNRRGSARS